MFDEDNDGQLFDGDKDECHSLPSKGFVQCMCVCMLFSLYVLFVNEITAVLYQILILVVYVSFSLCHRPRSNTGCSTETKWPPIAVW